MQIARLFKAQKNLKAIIDAKNSEFLKGRLSPKGEAQGARINQPPNGKVIDKAFSLFAKDLTIHDQYSDDHWDVLFRNKGGTYAYCYTLEKKSRTATRSSRKYGSSTRSTGNFPKYVSLALKDAGDGLALPMYTLLKTRMRIGNEIYYRANGHKVPDYLKEERYHRQW